MIICHPVREQLPVRRVGLKAQTKYSKYKNDLRSDFYMKCGYCGTHDYYSGGVRGFHIDHFAPKSRFAHLVNEYSNLIYCCPVCNLAKSDDWPSDCAEISFVLDEGYVDPCCSDYEKHLGRRADGSIVALTPLGGYISKKLKLFMRRRQVCWLIDRMETQLKLLDELIDTCPSDVDKLSAYRKLSAEYIRYIGVLKCE